MLLETVVRETSGDPWGYHRPDTQSESSNANGNFPHRTAARLPGGNTRLLPYVRTVYTANASAAAPASHGEEPAANQPNPGKQTHVLSLSLRRAVINHLRPAYLRL